MPIINSKIFKKKHNINIDKGLSLEQISLLSKMPVQALQEVYEKGKGAFFSNPSSVRPNVKTAHQWGMSRVYSFVMYRKGTYGGVDKHIAIKYKI